MGLIKLDYGVLAILSQSDMSGYDITNRLSNFWKTTHSRVYPVLSKLEKLGYVEHELVEQVNKPDKKIYHITEPGIGALRNWLIKDTQPSIKKDESLLKLISVHVLESDVIIDLLKERMKLVKKEEEFVKKVVENTKAFSNGVVTDTRSNLFNIHLLTQNILSHAQLELQWCEWAVELYRQKTADNFFDIKFNPCKNKEHKN